MKEHDLQDILGQKGYAVRSGWGLLGARAMDADVTVVVDILSFSTSVTIAVDRGMQVYPFRWRDDRARTFAAQRNAVLAVGRLEESRARVTNLPTLSPATLLTCDAVKRLVLPSPNGSSLVAALDDGGRTVVIGCLRNATAVAQHVAAAVEAGQSVGLVAAGERWPVDDSLRPAVEDHVGVGAIAAHLVERGHEPVMSPEALSAARLFTASAGHVAGLLRDCASGRELAAKGYGADVGVAAEVDTLRTVPVLLDGVFVQADDSGPRAGQEATVR